MVPSTCQNFYIEKKFLGFCINLPGVLKIFLTKVVRSSFKIYQIILSYPLVDCFQFRACLASRCLRSQNIYKYSNKPVKGVQKNNSKILRRSWYFDLWLLIFFNSSPIPEWWWIDYKKESLEEKKKKKKEMYTLV